ncbi:MAG: DUF962 domain-containing protein [Chitinophagales bacterium]|nr:DUF962 domain-containing protein [Chitinophagales bacterium]
MSQIQTLLNEYGESHQHPTNKAVHWICVPAIMVSLFGLLWSIPTPAFFHQLNWGPVSLNWAIIFMTLAMIYYLRLSVSLAVGMLFVGSFFLFIIYQLSLITALPLWAVCLIIFAAAWVGQFWGHKIEGKKPSFLKDIQFLLIGPVWLLHFIYGKLGIAY